MTAAFAPHEQRVITVVEEVVGPLVAEGRVELNVSPASDVHGALVEVKPTSEGPCPVTIHCEVPRDLDLYVGRHELTTHIWKTREWKRGDFKALEDELRDWLAALVAGRYEEEVELTKDEDPSTASVTTHRPGALLRGLASTMQNHAAWLSQAQRAKQSQCL